MYGILHASLIERVSYFWYLLQTEEATLTPYKHKANTGKSHHYRWIWILLKKKRNEGNACGRKFRLAPYLRHDVWFDACKCPSITRYHLGFWIAKNLILRHGTAYLHIVLSLYSEKKKIIPFNMRRNNATKEFVTLQNI